MEAAAKSALELEPAPPVKSSGALPTYVKSAKPNTDSFLPKDDLRLGTLDIETLRTTSRTTPELIRKLTKASPDLSEAVFIASRMVVTPNYVAVARNLDGTLNPEGTRLVQQLCRRIDLAGPVVKGYNDYPTLGSAAQSLCIELLTQGACSLELVLDKARLPEGLRPLAVTSIQFKYAADKRRVPFQVVSGAEISLDIPTFFYASIDQDLTTPYAESPMQAALQPIQASQAFFSDLRKVMRRAIHPRIAALINTEAWRKTVPPDVLHDPDKLKAYAEATITQIQQLLDNLGPEDALVNFDSVKLDYLTGGNISLGEEYKVLANILNGKVAAGAKAMPVVLGHEAAASANIASTQSMLGVKTYSSLQDTLNKLYSRALTMAVRLFGVDAVVEFKFDTIDLRPESELEAFRAMRQSRVLRELSLGLRNDEDASIELTGSLPAPGAPKLSGTRFDVANADNKNPTSNTADGQGSALNQDLKSTAPKGAKS